MRMSRRNFVATALAGAMLGVAGIGARAAEATMPTLRPMPAAGRGRVFGTTLDDLAALGYVEDEFLLGGEAERYIRTREAASSIKSIALSGMKRSVT